MDGLIPYGPPFSLTTEVRQNQFKLYSTNEEIEQKLSGAIPELYGWVYKSILGYTNHPTYNNNFGEPCTGAAIDDSTDILDDIYNPFIKCDCSFDNNSTCHITKLKVRLLNVSGVIPDELWTLTYLSHLDIGHNALSGEVPKELGLLTDLRGLYIDSSGVSDSNFAINCGGPQFTSSDTTLFEWDDKTLGSASYYVTDKERWAVSNVGNFTGTNPQYKISSSSQFTNTQDQELFHSARISASSLRYYGLGLKNGNYTGNRELEDFDIKKEAGGVSNDAVIREFKAQGKLGDGRAIAVKQLSVASHQGNTQFVTEIATISAVQHRNLVKLYGCCIEANQHLLVYEYLENKSLDQILFEYAMRGHLTEKTDVFAFGVVALEIVSGRPNSDSSLEEEQIYLLEWVRII
ncbi:hypothetical protein COLO4_38356 [Corchorus olitorius]|uniref:non-specific serine/threonine protein kinase n=1 Tax=Corchorus olitorius TaxID=93759 RepID=A0A1R3FVF3_9ROSI|nr:hypothetical protein COLO4_38356 [Corchorus olitorius]